MADENYWVRTQHPDTMGPEELQGPMDKFQAMELLDQKQRLGHMSQILNERQMGRFAMKPNPEPTKPVDPPPDFDPEA